MSLNIDNLFYKHVWYLEEKDFNKKGTFINKEKNPYNYPIVIMVQASWCGACKAMRPYYAKFAEKVDDDDMPILVTTADTGENPQMVDLLDTFENVDIRAYPTLILYVNNKVFKVQAGALQSVDDIMAFCSEQ